MSIFGNEEEFDAMVGDVFGSSEKLSDGNFTSKREELGSLRSNISATIHSKESAMLFTGKEKSETNRFGIIGVHGFTVAAAKMEQAIRRDDPYADYLFYQIHQELILAKKSVIEKREKFKNWLQDRIPANIQMTNCLNMNPLVFEMKFNSLLAYHVSYLIMEQDQFFRALRLAQHVGLIANDVINEHLREEQKTTRRIMANIFFYKHCDVTRNDAAANNQRWQNAVESMPHLKLTDEFLSGTLRSSIAPPITKRPEQDTTAKEQLDDPATAVSKLEATAEVITAPVTTETITSDQPVEKIA